MVLDRQELYASAQNGIAGENAAPENAVRRAMRDHAAQRIAAARPDAVDVALMELLILAIGNRLVGKYARAEAEHLYVRMLRQRAAEISKEILFNKIISVHKVDEVAGSDLQPFGTRRADAAAFATQQRQLRMTLSQAISAATTQISSTSRVSQVK